MKLLWGMALGFSLAANAQLQCEYANGLFRVTESSGKTYSQKVAPNAATALFNCGDAIAGIYDGWDLTVFNGRTKRFEWKRVQPTYDRSQLIISGTTLAFYDGAQFYVYSDHFSSVAAQTYAYAKMDGSSEIFGLYDGADLHVYRTHDDSFQHWKARSKSSNARITAFGKMLAFYDGGELSVFDGIRERMSNRVVKSSITSMLLAGAQSALFYEGETLTAYCSNLGGFKLHPTGKKDWGGSRYNAASDRFEFELELKKYFVDGTTCELFPL